jgi:hypothetical protein
VGIFGDAWEALCAGGLAQQSLQLLSVAQRLSWAARRRTTRAEDIAYCLMGLFGVHMPLLYGEGEANAFTRLQAEIARTTNDQSLFASGSWHDPDGKGDITLCYSLFAPHPSLFASAGDLKAASRHSNLSVLDGGWTPPFETPNDGWLRIRMRVCKNPDAERDRLGEADHVAFLECEVRGEADSIVGLFVQRLEDVRGMKRYVRMHRLLGKFPRLMALQSELEDVLLGALPRHIPRLEFMGKPAKIMGDETGCTGKSGCLGRRSGRQLKHKVGLATRA